MTTTSASAGAPGTTGSTTDSPGLTTTDVHLRLERDGPNSLPEPAHESAWAMFARQLTHLLALLLWVGAGLALLAGMPELSAAIVVIVLLNALFAFAQDYRADRSTQELRALLPAMTRVVRNGAESDVPVADLVVDDVVLLTGGDRIAADMLLVEAGRFAVDESMVTGESGAVARGVGQPVLAGTFVMSGEARAVVSATGPRTTIASIASMTSHAERHTSPLTLQLNRVVRVIALIAALTGVMLGIASLLLGLPPAESFLFGVGVSVALVPEGLLPTVTLSLAHGAQLMARQHALVRRLDAVETLGATTFICTDKTGTLTQNRMSVVEVVTPSGIVTVHGRGYDPVGTVAGDPEARLLAPHVAATALACVSGRTVQRPDGWTVDGDPMDAAVHCLSLRLGVPAPRTRPERVPYTAERLMSSALVGDRVAVLGAPEAVLARCAPTTPLVHDRLLALTDTGRRVLAVATRTWSGPAGEEMEHDLEFLGLLALQDPPRPDVSKSLHLCRKAGIRVAMLTGDHPRTAKAIAEEVGLLGPLGQVLDGGSLPDDDATLADLLDNDHGAVVARVTPAGKLRIARELRARGYVVAMTGDGVNDAPALRESDVGVAMGASGSDVARESADLVLLDDHFATIVRAIEQGRATFQNVRRFLTYHLTDNVAELAPFALWALTGGSFPLAIGVLQVLALDIGTDMLPALALGREPPRRGLMDGLRRRVLVDRALLARSFGLLGATEAAMSLGAFAVVLLHGGWHWGTTPEPGLLAVASGTAFAAIALGQMANAFACRSTSRFVWNIPVRDNLWVLAAVAAELVLLLAFVGIPWLADLLGGSWPSTLGWLAALASPVAVIAVDSISKRRTRR
ncbi:cation-transporting P-type ATPase [Nocardioides agariphilus]|uniref:Cation-transporting P-type ATPase n=1 Tax=Nocardioides agariphilus TaxID=433664 RepID=A0A930VM46_9ACTN|nr:cation-transporting P-type ATPase [Nocardioides agariphilus]MBF4767166.1 cation-transporting P-type ATPase [Nocardioides agariphilus]